MKRLLIAMCLLLGACTFVAGLDREFEEVQCLRCPVIIDAGPADVDAEAD